MDESNIQQNTDKSHNEIDLFEFGLRIWEAFKKFMVSIKDLIVYLIIHTKDFIVSIIIFLLRKSLWIASFAIIGIMIGFIVFSVQRPSYLFTSEVETGGIDNSVVIEHVNRLEQLIGDTLLLSKHLNLTIEQAKEIRSIKACYGIDQNGDGKPDYIDITGDKFRHKDTSQTRVPSFVHFRLSLYDKDVLPAVRNSLYQYIQKNTYIQNLYKIDREQKKALIDELDKEILGLGKIDSVQLARMYRKFDSNAEKGQMFILNNNEAEIKLFYNDVLKLFNRKQEMQRHVDLIHEPVVIIHDFIPTALKERPLRWYFIRCGGMMAVLGIVCAVIWQYRRSIWKLLKEDSDNK